MQDMTPEEREAMDHQIESLTSMDAIYETMYKFFSRKAYGTEMPYPAFYLGTNKSGDLKWRSPLPIALSGGEYMRMFYTPYPSLFITQGTMRTILDNLAFKERFHSLNTDYKDRYSAELVEAEYQRVMALSSDPSTTLGFSRQVVPAR
jgi:hypothetical protein